MQIFSILALSVTVLFIANPFIVARKRNSTYKSVFLDSCEDVFKLLGAITTSVIYMVVLYHLAVWVSGLILGVS